MKKTIIIITSIILTIVIFIIPLISINPVKKISGIDNYNKNYYLKEYGGDLDSNLSIFPNNKDNIISGTFSSSFKTNLFDSDGYILLTAKYQKEDFNNEINRLKKLNITIYETCKDNAKSYTNYVKYDDKLYKYKAYIAIDGFDHTYEYALINEKDLEIIYLYLSYPKINNSKYKKYLKKDLSLYSITNTIDMYSMYNHSFDNNKSFIEFSDCN